MDLNQLKKQFSQSSSKTPNVGMPFKVFGTLAAVGVLGYSSLFNVDSGHRAIKFSKLTGTLPYSYKEGTHFRIPFIENVIDYEIRAKARVVSSLTATRDLQMVNISLRVLTRPDEDKLCQIYRTLGADYDERVLPSIINEVLKAVVAQFPAQDLITLRAQISKLIKEGLEVRARKFNIILDDTSITHLSFGENFANAVEAKQVASQEAQRARFLVDRALQEKERSIVAAQGASAAAKMLSDQIRDNPDFLTLRKLEAAVEISEKLANSKNTIYLDSHNLLVNIFGGAFKSHTIQKDNL